MNTTKRALATLALAGATLTITGTAHASGILGLGDTGGNNRDESLNQSVNVIGDSFMNGGVNVFAPQSTTGGIDGVGMPHLR
ncbi:hypothetical protein [Streptomyces sp. NBC_00299]|uniref:hypothetical protein n=1 Tax=Streptomyces sp. NBC_00299 TaxID=2975705 RepID=UPI002E285E01|nr:hypothetical protein [Streptomyces sp. NBC_00299]